MVNPVLAILSFVALLAEGVDRNQQFLNLESLPEVALLAEGVDRNTDVCQYRPVVIMSPSSRRAWIEIRSCCRCTDCS